MSKVLDDDIWVFHSAWLVFGTTNVAGLLCRWSEGRHCAGACGPDYDHPVYYAGALMLTFYMGEMGRWRKEYRRPGFWGERLDGILGLGLLAFWVAVLAAMEVASLKDPRRAVPEAAVTMALMSAWAVLGSVGSRWKFEAMMAKKGGGK